MEQMDLEQFCDRTSDNYIVKTVTDDSGDYTHYHHSIIAKMKWGDRTICEGVENPRDARMFASAPQMINEILWLRSRIANLEMVLEKTKNTLEQLDEQ